MSEEVESKIPIHNDKKVILQKARDAKKIKKEINERQLQNYNTELENIQNHLIRMNTQLNTLVSIIPTIPPSISPNPQMKRKREDDEDENHEVKKSLMKEETKITIDQNPPSTLISGDFSYIIGQAVAGAIALGSYFYFRKGKNNNINPAHAKYDSMYFQ